MIGIVIRDDSTGEGDDTDGDLVESRYKVMQLESLLQAVSQDRPGANNRKARRRESLFGEINT